jgi:hypothetical protein
MIYFKEKYVRIQWDEKSKAVVAEWLGYIDGQDLRRALDAGLELLAQKKTNRWLGDATNLGPIPIEDQRWTNEDWFPRVISAGLRYMAVIEPHKVVAQMSVKRILSRVHGKDIVTAHFDTQSEARAWLRAQK